MHEITKPPINQHETHGADDRMARSGALSAQKDTRLAELADCWDKLSENQKAALLTLARGMIK